MMTINGLRFSPPLILLSLLSKQADCHTDSAGQLNFTHLCRFRLPTEFAAHNRTEDEIVKFNLHAVQAEYRGDLCPVPDLVHQDVNNDLPGSCSHDIVHQLHLNRDVPAGIGYCVDVRLQFPAALRTECEECIDISDRYRCNIRDWPPGQSVHVTLF